MALIQNYLEFMKTFDLVQKLDQHILLSNLPFPPQSVGPDHGVAFRSWSGGGAAVPCKLLWIPKGFR